MLPSLHAACVEPLLPSAVEGDDLVDVVAEVADVQHLEVLEEVAVRHPEAAVVERLRVLARGANGGEVQVGW